jgi:hypothetical protein
MQVSFVAMVALLLGSASHAQAVEVCKWVDASGQTQFGDCRLAPTAKAAKLDIRPSAPSASEGRSLPPPAIAAPAASAALRTKFPPPGAPAPAGWTSTCEKLAQHIADLRPGTPFQSESDQIMRDCPGLAYHCEFRFQQPETNRCGPIAKSRSQHLVSNEYYGYPEGSKLPTYKDLQGR